MWNGLQDPGFCFAVFLLQGVQALQKLPSHAHLGLAPGKGGEALRDKVRLPNTAMVTGAVAHCFTFFEEDSPVLLRLASNSWAQVIILLAPSFLEQ